MEYIEKLGLPVFPTHNKIPRVPKGVSWSSLSSSNPKTVEAWGAKSYGVDLGKVGLTVVDIDKKHGKNGFLTLKSWCDERGIKMPKTFSVKTPSGGMHLYYKGVTGNGVLTDGVDIKSLGGYVISPDSETEDGLYLVKNDIPIATLPTEIREQMHTQRRADNAKEAVTEVDSEARIREATAYLLKQAPAIEGEGGDLHTYNVACGVRGRGVSEEVCLDLMLEHWNDKCEPPWDIKGLRTKVSNAYNYALNPIGGDSHEDDIAKAFSQEALPEEGSVPRKWNSFIGEPPPVKWAVENWLIAEPTVSLLVGQGGIGKSFMALDLALCLNTGLPWFGNKIVKGMPTLYVSCEDNEDVIHRRIHGISGKYKKEHGGMLEVGDDLLVWSRVGMDNILAEKKQQEGLVEGPFYKVLCKQLEAMGDGVKLLIIDTVADVYAGDENDRTTVSQFVKKVVGGIAVAHNCHVILLAHPPKSGSVYSGSTAWQGSVRCMISATKADDVGEGVVRVEVAKSNYSETGVGMLLGWDEGCYAEICESDLITKAKRLIMDYIIMYPHQLVEGPKAKGTNIYEVPFLDKGVPLPEPLVRRCIKELKLDGAIVID